MKFQYNNPVLYIFGIVLILVIVSSNLNWGQNHWEDIIESDAKGYYAYLPAVFIYQDLNYGFFDRIEKGTYYNKNLFYDYRQQIHGKITNKYFCGTAVAEMPFFILAHGLSILTGFPADGYSKFYHIFVNIAAIVYAFIGLMFLRKTLETYTKKNWVIIIILLTIVFGTNLFYYIVCEPGMSHVYSFAFISMFVFFAHRFFSTSKAKYLIGIGVASGMICLIRPVNVLIFISLPFIAGTFGNFIAGIKLAFGKPIYLIVCISAFLLITSIQLLIYKISTGHWIIDSYQGEHFEFLSPHFIDILLSYKKGLFLYTPVYLLSFLGCRYLYRESRFACFTWLVFFILITYVFSSWSCWYYGGSFSGRIYVEYLPFFAILLTIASDRVTRQAGKTTVIALIISFIVLCQIQTYQYRYYQIHWSDMTKEKYWEVFLRIDKFL